VDGAEQRVAVGADDDRLRLPRLLAGRQAFVLDPATVPLGPDRRALGAQPVGGSDGERVERVAHRLADHLEPVERADLREHVRGVGALPAARLQQPPSAAPVQEPVEQEPFGLAVEGV
jgi:hypothetical protein